MSNLPEKWGKGRLPEGWGKRQGFPPVPVPKEQARPSDRAAEAGGQAEASDNHVVEQLQEQEQAIVFEDISSTTQSFELPKTEDSQTPSGVVGGGSLPAEHRVFDHIESVDDGAGTYSNHFSRNNHSIPNEPDFQLEARSRRKHAAKKNSGKLLPGILVSVAVIGIAVVGIAVIPKLHGNIPAKETNSSGISSESLAGPSSQDEMISQIDSSPSPDESSHASDRSVSASEPTVEPKPRPTSTPEPTPSPTATATPTSTPEASISSNPNEPPAAYCSVCGADCTYRGLIDGMCEDCYEIYGQPYNEPNVYCPNCNYGFTVSGVGISGFECPQCHYKFYDPEDSYSQEFYDIAGYYEGYQILVNSEPHDIDSSNAQLTLYADGSAYLYYAGTDFSLSWDVGEMWDESAPSEIVYFDVSGESLTMHLPDGIEVLFSKMY